jgi:hypothetical protein
VPKNATCTFFNKIKESSPYMYASVGYYKSVRDHLICDANHQRITTIKQEKHMFYL